MKQFISISEIGSISVLGVHLGSTADEVKEKLSNLNVHENKNCWDINTFCYDHLPKMSITFRKGDDECICDIKIRSFTLTKEECNILYEYFRQIFHKRQEFYESPKKKGEYIISKNFSNLLHRVIICWQEGIGDDKEMFAFAVYIEGKFIFNKKNIEENASIAKEIYNYELPQRVFFKDKSKMDKYKILKILFALCVLIISYLFVLSYRYKNLGNEIILDSWTKNVYIINDAGYLVPCNEYVPSNK